MATPKVMTDGSTALTEANLNLYARSKLQVKIYHVVVKYSGGNLVVDSDFDSYGPVTGDLTYDGTNKVLNITLAGFTNPPVAVATPKYANANYNIKAHATSNTNVRVAFYAISNGANVDAASPDANMNFNLLIIGY